MNHEEQDKKLKDFLKRNGSSVPGAPDGEFLDIQKQMIEETRTSRHPGLWLWGPAIATLSCLIVGAVLTMQQFDPKEEKATNIEIASMIWESYSILDEPLEDPLEEIY